MKQIPRPVYLKEIIGYRDTTQLVKVITGIRRCGKSTLLEMYQDHLLAHGVKRRQVQSVNLDDAVNRDIDRWEALHDKLASGLLENTQNYLFIDEVQNVPDFQRAVNSLALRQNVDLYITGSNANLLSGELATLLSGRYVEIKMQPLSFAEYLSARPDAGDLPAAFNAYVTDSSFPYTLAFGGNRRQIDSYLDAVYSAVVLKDVISRNRVSDPARLEKVIRYIADNIGNLTSINNIKNQMESDRFKIDVRTIENYLDALVRSFILYRVGRYDIKGKDWLKTNDKYYIADLGLRRMLTGRGTGDFGRVLENVVYLELLRRGYRSVSVGKVGDKEVDFVAAKYDGGCEYFQVAQTVMDEKTLEREFSALDAIDDHYPKTILSMDTFTFARNGIRQMNVLEWMR